MGSQRNGSVAKWEGNRLQLCDHQFKSDRNLQSHGVVAE